MEEAPPSVTAAALASTRLAGAEITVYYDRVLRQRLSRTHRVAGTESLGYVFAHELAHAMQGIARHSTSGILKAHWSEEDFTAILGNNLAFTDTDTTLIRKGLSSRPAALARKE